ncbi:MAG: response regulator [Dehalococcoidia bacterium]
MSRILVVDDQDEIREALVVILEDEGHEVLEAESGHKALELSHASHPDVVLLDIAMPEMDGLETLRRLKADAVTRGIAVIMVTAQSDRHNLVTAVQLGVRDYITKPWESGEVEMCVNWALRAVQKARLAAARCA